MGWRPNAWRGYPECHRCHAPRGKPCTAVAGSNGRRRGDVMKKPHGGRCQTREGWRREQVRAVARCDRAALSADRLIIWKRLATRGVSVADIAHQLGMNRAALDQFVVRARRNGHPDAVYHAAVQHIWHTRTSTRRRPC